MYNGIKKIRLSEVEIIILENIGKQWNYIARNECGNLQIFMNKPFKVEKGDDYELGFWETFLINEDEGFSAFNHLFQFVRWSNEEPYLISELLKWNK